MSDPYKEWPTNGIEIINWCPVCGEKSDNSEVLYKDLTDRIFFCAPGRWSLIKCNACKSAYINPRPNKETIGLAYKKYFTHDHNKNKTELKKNFLCKMKSALTNGYRNWRFGTSFQPSTCLGVFVVKLFTSKRREIDANMRHLPKPEIGQKLLDYGCGNGGFLINAQAAGWQVTGIDLDPKAVAAAQSLGLNVKQGGVEELESLEDLFDVITLSHVIEHVHSPKKLLDACYKKLKPGGRLWIETPNLESQGHKIYSDAWRDLDAPRHLVIFNIQSIEWLINKVGFKAIKHESEHPAINMVFSASEAIHAGVNPITENHKWMGSHSKKWKENKVRSKKLVEEREFITLTAYK